MMKNNVLRLLRPVPFLTGFWCCLLACGYGQDQKPEEVDADDGRWKKTDNLTITSENVTKRVEELEHSQDSDRFVYFRATDNNREKFRAACKFIPVVHRETNAEVEAKLVWKMEDDRGQVVPREEELAWESPYEADLQQMGPDNNHRILVYMQARLKYPGEEKEMKIVKGQLRRVFVDDPQLQMQIKSISFNTAPGKIDNDAFDVVDKVKGRVINNTPEFKDGKPVKDNTIVVYPVKSTPVVKTELQLISRKLSAAKLEKYEWGARAEQFEEEDKENVLKKLKLQGKIEKSIQNGKLLLTGNFVAEEALGEKMRKGKIDLEWVLREKEEDIYLKKLYRSTMPRAYLILRQKEIDQSAAKDTKIWEKGIELAVDKLLRPTPKGDPQTCSKAGEYAKMLVQGIYQNSWYPEKFTPKYSRRYQKGKGYVHDISLNTMVNDFSEKKMFLICVEAAALFRSMQNMVTDGEATAQNLVRKNDWGHQVGIYGEKVYDGTPCREPTDGQRLPLGASGAGTMTLDEFIDQRNEGIVNDRDRWYISEGDTEHRLIN